MSNLTRPVSVTLVPVSDSVLTQWSKVAKHSNHKNTKGQVWIFQVFQKSRPPKQSARDAIHRSQGRNLCLAQTLHHQPKKGEKVNAEGTHNNESHVVNVL